MEADADTGTPSQAEAPDDEPGGPLPSPPRLSPRALIALNTGAGLVAGFALLFLQGSALVAAPVAVCILLGVARLAVGPRIRPIVFLGGFAIPMAACMTLLFVIPDLSERLQRRAFDAAAWQARGRNESRSPDRIRMIDDLLKTHDVRGWGRTRVLVLLGPGDDSPWRAPDRLVYWLGPERDFLGMDSEWLSISFDASDRVVEWRIVTD